MPPAELTPTLVLAPPSPPQPPPDGPLRWLSTLRARLALTYAALLIALFILVGFVLNLAISNILYAQEHDRLLEQARAGVLIAQRDFDQAVHGRGPNCLDAQSYQQAFTGSVGSLAQQPAFDAVYLLDNTGAVLAPENAPVPVGQRAPYFNAAQAAQLRQKAIFARARPKATGVLADQAYDTHDASGARIGVILIAESYQSASTCVGAAAPVIGIVEVVANYHAVQSALTRLHFILLLLIAAILVLGIVVGAPLAASALRPLTRMTAIARRIAQGDLTQRVRLPHSGDEIGQLADAFDEMIGRIEAAFAAQRASEDRMRQFVADASHELRTPLTSIRGYTDVLLRGAKDDPETAQQVLLATRRESERMSRLVNDLLTLARLDAGRPLELQRVDLIGLVGEAVDQARILAGEREVALQSDGGGRLPVSADPDRLKQVLLILLDNALKYGRQDTSGWVRVQVGRTAHGAYVSVADNGAGIPPEDLPHIFDRFYRAQRAAMRRRSGGPASMPAVTLTPPTADSDQLALSTVRRPPAHEGSGLGLAIAQAIVHAHGGALSVRSQPGNGATFTLELPLAHPSPRGA
jgi:two-component system OmpR family sensor kinase